MTLAILGIWAALASRSAKQGSTAELAKHQAPIASLSETASSSSPVAKVAKSFAVMPDDVHTKPKKLELPKKGTASTLDNASLGGATEKEIEQAPLALTTPQDPPDPPISESRAVENTERRNVQNSVVLVQTQDSTGSGFFVGKLGQVATAYHVIEGAASVKIVLPGGKELEASGWVAIAPEKDLALIQCRDVGFESVSLAIRKTLPRQSESVFAFGAPLGLQGSVSDGIISAIRSGNLPRELELDASTTLIQTTAPISSGNSGGPLVDVNGEVLGVNSFTLSKGQNVNFAISATHLFSLVSDASEKAEPWKALPPVRKDHRQPVLPDNKAQADASRRAQADAYRKAQADADAKAQIRQVEESIAIISAEGKELTRQREQMEAEVTAVTTEGQLTEQRNAALVQELNYARQELNSAAANDYYGDVIIYREEVERLEVELSILRQNYSRLVAKRNGLQHEIANLTSRIDAKLDEREMLEGNIVVIEESAPSLQLRLPADLDSLSDDLKLQLRVRLRNLHPAHAQRFINKLVKATPETRERLVIDLPR